MTDIISTSNSFPNKLLPLTGAVICFILAGITAVWCWAQIITIRPEQTIKQWEKDPLSINVETAESFIPRVQRAIILNSLDANSSLILAKLYELLATEQNSTTYRELAENAYKSAIKKQSTWDYAWAKLAHFYSQTLDVQEVKQNKALSLAYTNKLVNTLFTAMTLGPYEYKNQKLVIPLIFKHWDHLEKQPAIKNQATKVIKHTLKHHRYTKLAMESANKYNKLETLAPMLERQSHKNRLERYQKESRIRKTH